ncbi:cysteine desulfurase family protein [Fervidibacillus halotolerans]|uniref:cysteine desulfurase n=1 Tax=Fervidibacillus halotolerans TaxID=2980027 RepID=A0A9E8RWA9_9BACI|nr:cysteine desulfurase family protein [Fervidibacillus halotolerans]WAA11550.1 cysteine desulfurase [Fervidibacillus halotolerans]
MDTIYLDHAATTPVHPEVVREMVGCLEKTYGNPSSIHGIGRQARRLVDQARNLAAQSIGAKFNEIIFTSGGTEADNLALIGTAFANRNRGNHIITTSIEHPAILQTCKYLEINGFDVTYLPVDSSGRVDIDTLKKHLRDDTILVSVMYANNEVGTIQPIQEIAQLLSNHSAIFHTDAVQAYGLLPIDCEDLGVDLLSVSAHKINGPKGIGFLYAKNGVKFTPHQYGGEQERKRRAGTENVPGIVGFAKAIEIMMKKRVENFHRYEQLRRLFIDTLNDRGISFEVNGDLKNGLPHILNISFPETNVEQMLVNLDLEGIAASGGSACTAGAVEPSHVLKAMFGAHSEKLFNSVRFSFGYGLTEENIQKAAEKTADIVKRLTS